MSWATSKDKGSEASLEHRPGTVEPLTHRAGRQLQVPGDILGLPVFQVFQDKHDPV